MEHMSLVIKFVGLSLFSISEQPVTFILDTILSSNHLDNILIMGSRSNDDNRIINRTKSEKEGIALDYLQHKRACAAFNISKISNEQDRARLWNQFDEKEKKDMKRLDVVYRECLFDFDIEEEKKILDRDRQLKYEKSQKVQQELWRIFDKG